MPVQLRKRYDTRLSQPANPRLPPSLPFVATRTRNSNRSFNGSNSANVFFSDEEPSQQVNHSREERERNNQEQSVQIKVEMPSDEDAPNIQEVVKNCRPSSRKSKKLKKRRAELSSNVKSREKMSVELTERKGKEDSNLVEAETCAISMMAVSGQKQEAKPQRKAAICGERMVDEREQSQKQKAALQIEEKMLRLAQMTFNDKKMKCPFEVLGQYRPSFESEMKQDYRDYLKTRQAAKKNIARQKMAFRMMRERQADKLNGVQKQRQAEQIFRAQCQTNDRLFEKCRGMSRQEQLDYLRDYCNEMVTFQARRRQEQLMNAARLEKLKKFNISNLFSQRFNFGADKSQSRQSFCSVDNTTISQKGNQVNAQTLIKNQTLSIKGVVNEDIKIENNSLTANEAIGGQLSGASPTKQIKSVEAQSVSSKHPEIPNFSQERAKKKVRIESSLKPQSVESDHLSQGSRKDQKQIKSYNRNKILAQINLVNRKCAEAEKLSQIDEEKKENLNYLPSNNVELKEESQAVSLEHETVRTEGFGEIEIRTQQGTEKTEQQTRPDYFSYEYKQSAYRDSEGSIWSGYSRGGPKVKRLQILNRYHYNPFEQTNGEDQCELWKRLMSDQVQDLKSFYKFQDASEFDSLFNEFQKMDKGNTLLLKVKEQDFFVSHLYDPVKKELVDDKEVESLRLKREQNAHLDGYLYPERKKFSDNYYEDQDDDFNIRKSYEAFQASIRAIPSSRKSEGQPSQMVSQIKTVQSNAQQTGLSVIKQQAERLQKSFNYDQLQDLSVPVAKKQCFQGSNVQIQMSEISAGRKQLGREDVLQFL